MIFDFDVVDEVVSGDPVTDESIFPKFFLFNNFVILKSLVIVEYSFSCALNMSLKFSMFTGYLLFRILVSVSSIVIFKSSMYRLTSLQMSVLPSAFCAVDDQFDKGI